VRLPVLGREDVTGGGAVPVATASQIVAALSRAAPVRSQLNLVIELDLAARVVAEGAARAALSPHARRARCHGHQLGGPAHQRDGRAARR
jgi:hypothetical protein